MANAKKKEAYSGWGSGKCIVVGITGGIAAYKVPHLVHQLTYQGAEVHVVLTAAGAQFVTPLTLQTLSGHPVRTGMFESGPPRGASLASGGPDWTMEHIDLADRADLVVVAPATANVLAKAAHGLADDLLSTLIVSTRAPVLFCPAMNVHMYENPIVRENVAKLQSRGYRVLEPAEGDLACGYEGRGRLPEPEVILGEIKKILKGTHH
jgi:phosphopantothenoylcysteine decarboxylase/phosphopantothenate--cysteine ligase